MVTRQQARAPGAERTPREGVGVESVQDGNKVLTWAVRGGGAARGHRIHHSISRVQGLRRMNQ